jgi:ATP-dependent DNA helicase RecQ
MTVEEVAQRRGLTNKTIAGHIERLIQSGEQLDLSPLMPPQERFDAIRAAFVESGGTFLSPVKEILGDDYSYDEIRLVWLFLDQKDRKSEQSERIS